MRTFYTADTHFGHAAVIVYSRRPFRDVAHMEEELVTRWNAVVGPRDEVHHLGDFGYLKRGDAERVLARLNGRKYLTVGNHDSSTIRNARGWENVALDREVRVAPNETRVVLHHYAKRVWNRCHFGALHLFGHSHGNMPGNSQSLDVGVDCWDFTPVTLEQVRERMAVLERFRAPDHHVPRDPLQPEPRELEEW